jgi:glucose 1-dehydrogenase
MVQTAIDTCGRLDVLVNNAGMATRGVDPGHHRAGLRPSAGHHLKSAFFGTQFAAKQFIAPIGIRRNCSGGGDREVGWS